MTFKYTHAVETVSSDMSCPVYCETEEKAHATARILCKNAFTTRVYDMRSGNGVLIASYNRQGERFFPGDE